MLPLISLEEHYISEAIYKSPSIKKLGLDLFPPAISERLLSLGSRRIQDMNTGAISMQVISHTPGVEPPPLDICVAANNELYHAFQNNKSRYAGFAMLPMDDPFAAAAELERCVKELGFVGTLVPNHAHGRYYDDEHFWPIFAKAQELDVPIYLHPTSATAEKKPDFDGNYPEAFAAVLSAYGWGWHSDTGLHFLKLYGAGVFDRFPRLKIIIGHMGEMLPFMLDRIERFSVNWGTARERRIRTVWDENVWVTTSGMFYLAPFACLVRAVKMDRILYSVDYPFESNEQGRVFIEKIEKSGLVTDKQLAMIAYGNAEELLKIRVQHCDQQTDLALNVASEIPREGFNTVTNALEIL